MVATGRKLALLYYRMLRYGIAYVEQGLEVYEQPYREDPVKYLKKKVKMPGFAVVVTNA